MTEIPKQASSFDQEHKKFRSGSKPSANTVEKLRSGSKPSANTVVPRPNQPKRGGRLAAIFGNRKNRNVLPHAPSQEMEKDLKRAISDGNMKAVEANMNAEDAPPLSGKPHVSKSMLVVDYC